MSRRVERIRKECETCGQPIFPLPREVQRGRGRFCSRSCFGKTQGASSLSKRAAPYVANAGSFKKGERTGASHPRWKQRMQCTCKFCLQPFEVQQWVARQPNNKNLFCSVRCRSRYRSVFLSGPYAPDWKGGKTTYRGPNWIEVRTEVVRDQKGACAHCHKYVGKRLPIHHIKPFREFKSYVEANQRGNLIGLCQSCHMRAEYPGQGLRRKATTPLRDDCPQGLDSHNPARRDSTSP